MTISHICRWRMPSGPCHVRVKRCTKHGSGNGQGHVCRLHQRAPSSPATPAPDCSFLPQAPLLFCLLPNHPLQCARVLLKTCTLQSISQQLMLFDFSWEEQTSIYPRQDTNDRPKGELECEATHNKHAKISAHPKDKMAPEMGKLALSIV